MDKAEIKKHCDAIEEMLTDCLDYEELEDVREHLREIKGEAQPVKVALTTLEVELLDKLDSDGVLNEYYFNGKQGWEFIATPEAVRLFKKTILKELDGLIGKITHAVEE